MAGGGNGQARESAELQKSQSNQSERYGIAGDMYGSKQYLSALRTKDGETCGCNSGVSRTFGQSVSDSDSKSELRAERDMKMKADRERSEQINQLNWQRLQGLKGSKYPTSGDDGSLLAQGDKGRAATRSGEVSVGTMSASDTAAAAMKAADRQRVGSDEKANFERMQVAVAVSRSGLSTNRVIEVISQASQDDALATFAKNNGEFAGSGPSSSFGQAVSKSELQASLRTENDSKMKADRERSEQINQVNWQRFQGLKGSKDPSVDTTRAATKLNDSSRPIANNKSDGSMSAIDTAAAAMKVADRERVGSDERANFERAQVSMAVSQSGLSTDKVLAAIQRASVDEALATFARNEKQAVSLSK